MSTRFLGPDMGLSWNKVPPNPVIKCHFSYQDGKMVRDGKGISVYYGILVHPFSDALMSSFLLRIRMLTQQKQVGVSSSFVSCQTTIRTTNGQNVDFPRFSMNFIHGFYSLIFRKKYTTILPLTTFEHLLMFLAICQAQAHLLWLRQGFCRA